jgi:hypothetical protein
MTDLDNARRESANVRSAAKRDRRLPTGRARSPPYPPISSTRVQFDQDPPENKGYACDGREVTDRLFDVSDIVA